MGTTAIARKPEARVWRLKIPEEYVEIRYAKPLDHREFAQFCAENPDLRIEKDKNGALIIMPPINHDGGIAEGKAYGYLFAWWTTHENGRVYSPTTGFELADGSIRSADGAWADEHKVKALTRLQRQKFAPFAPDFVIEVRSATDRLSKLQRKMTDVWIKNGVRLAWLLDPKKETAYIYRANGAVEVVKGFDGTLSGEDVCPGLVFDLKKMRL